MRLTALLSVFLGLILVAAAVGLSYRDTMTPGVMGAPCGPTYLTSISTYITEHQTPSNCSAPNGLASDEQGRIWFVEENVSKLAMYDPAADEFVERDLPISHPISWGMAVSDDGDVWLTEANSSSILRFRPSSGKFEVHPLRPNSFPFQMLTGPDGDVWFSELYGRRIGRIDPMSGNMSEYDIPWEGMGPSGLAFDAHGVLWIAMVSFSQDLQGVISSFDPVNLTFSSYRTPLVISNPTGIAVDGTGKVWVTDHGSSLLIRYDPVTGDFMRVATSQKAGTTSTLPYWLVKGPDGQLWFNEHYANRIGRFDALNMTMTEYSVPSYVPTYGGVANVLSIAVDPAGNLWFTEWSTGRIGVVNSSLRPDISLSGMGNISLRTGEKLQYSFEFTSRGTYSGPLSYGVASSETSDGTPKWLTIYPMFTLNSLNSSASSGTIYLELKLEDDLGGDFYALTVTVAEKGISVSAVAPLHVERGP